MKRDIRDKVDEYTETRDPSPSKRTRTDYSELKREAKEVCDAIISHAKERFKFVEHLVAASLLFPEMFSGYRENFPDEKLKTVCKCYCFLNQ